jgi:hypothetical protein
VCFDFYRDSQLKTALSVRGDFELGVLNNVGTVKILGLMEMN